MSTSVPPPRARRRRAPAERPNEILAAALEEFAARGFQAARLEDVARRAGCSKAAIYLYYKDKTALFEAVVRRWFVGHVNDARALVATHSGPMAPMLHALVTRTVDLIGQPPVPDIIRLVVGESRAFPHLARFWHDEVVDRMLPLIADAVRAGIATGEFRPVDAGHVARSLMTPLVFTALWRSVFEPIGAEKLDIAGFTASHVDLVLAGLSSAPESRP
jgi:AcrR family transcriptional regulator